MGGLEKSLVRILDKMCNMPEYEFTILVNDSVTEKYFLDFFAEKGIRLIEIPNEFDILGKKPYNFFARKFWKIKRLVLRKKIKKKIKLLVYKYLSNQDLIMDYFNCSFYSYIKDLNIPKIGWYHGNFSSYTKSHNYKELDCYDKFVCLTDSFKKQLLKSANQYSDKVIRIYNSINVEEIENLANNAYHPPVNERYFVFVGRIDIDKDHLTVIEAFRKFSQKHTDAKIYFIGDGGKRKEYEQIVKKYKLDDKIIFTGTLDNPLGYIKHSVASILSSKGEGFGITLIETASLKTLSIASDVPDSIREILLDGDAGLLFPFGDSDKLNHLMTEVWENKIPVQNMINTGFNNIDRFETNSILSEIDYLIKKNY